MSQPDLARTLRSARPVAPPELRERVRLVAAQASPPRRQPVTWRRALVVVVVVGAAVAAGVIVTRPSHRPLQRGAVPQPVDRQAVGPFSTASSAAKARTVAPAPSATRLQRYTASLELRVPTSAMVSSAATQAVAIANSLGGYLAYSNINAGGKTGYAEIRLRVPKVHVQEAVRRLSALGRVVGENVQIQDLTAGVNATDRLIARLQQQLAGWRAVQPPTTRSLRHIDQLTTQIQQLQGGRSTTVRSAHDATVELNVSTPPVTPPKQHHPGPLHGLGTAFRWIGIGAVYGLAVGAPFVALSAAIWLAVRALRRRREDSLLSRS